MTCIKCDGHKRTPEVVTFRDGSMTSTGYWETCPLCKGTGEDPRCCATCAHWDAGSCSEVDVYEGGIERAIALDGEWDRIDIILDISSGWDGHSVSVGFGPRFQCRHWTPKEVTP